MQSISTPTLLLTLLSFISTTLAATNTSSSNNQTMIDGPLFDKYQFFTPGIFMTFTVGLMLLFILGVGLTALSSLEVTYAAFEKESGPGSKKQQ